MIVIKSENAKRVSFKDPPLLFLFYMSLFIFPSSSPSSPSRAVGWCARVSACRPFFTASSLLDCVPDLCGASLPEYISLPPLSLSHFQALLLYPCGPLQFKEQQTGGLPLHPTRCTRKRLCYTCLDLIKKGHPLRTVNPSRQTDSKAAHAGKWVWRRRTAAYLLFCSVTHTCIDPGGKGWSGNMFGIVL